MGKIQIDHTGSGGGITLSSDGTDLLLGGTAIGGGGASAYTIDDKTADYTAVSGDLGKIIRFTVDSAVTLTLPTASSVGEGWYITVFSSGGNIVTVARTGSSDLFDSNQYNSGNASTFVSSGSSVTFVSDGSSVWHSLSENIYFYAEYNQNTGLFKPQATAKSAIAIGRSATASGTNSMALGSNSSFLGSVSAGSGSVALNGSYASGTNSLAAAIASNSSSYGATGANSVAMGQQAKATGQDSVAIGRETQASGGFSLSLGKDGSALASGSVVISAAGTGYGTQASGVSSIALGDGTKTTQKGQISYASHRFASRGDGQGSLFTLYADTTDATATVLTTDNGTAGGANQIVAASDTCITFDGTITAMQNGAQAYASWRIEGLLVNDGGTTTLANSATTVIDNQSSWVMALSADDTNNALAITCTGEASHNIRWVANIRTTQVTYA